MRKYTASVHDAPVHLCDSAFQFTAEKSQEKVIRNSKHFITSAFYGLLQCVYL